MSMPMRAQLRSQYHARRMVISGVGHLMYLEKPKEFTELVSRFVEQND